MAHSDNIYMDSDFATSANNSRLATITAEEDLTGGGYTYDTSGSIEMVVMGCMEIDFYVRSYVSFQIYKTFSTIVNGFLTAALALFGCCGNVALFRQVNKLPISRRLKTHLRFLSFWDSLLLLCSFLSHGLMSIFYGISPLYGGGVYLLYVFHPLGSFSVTGTIWQVVAITTERYLAVTRPFEARMGRCDVNWICFALFMLAVTINLPTSLVEKQLEECVEVADNGTLIKHVTMGFTPIHANKWYTLFCQFIPDLLFRCPLPFIFVAVCTVYTLQKCRNRTIGAVHITASRTVPVMLTLLNVKFLFCNTMYMVNTGLDLVNFTAPSTTPNGGGGANMTTPTGEQLQAAADANMRHFILTLYLTDIANIMLVIHSATNWLLFFRWPISSHRGGHHDDSKAAIITSALAQRLGQIIDNYDAEELGTGLLVAVGRTNIEIGKVFNENLTTSDETLLRRDPKLQEQGEIIGSFITRTVHQFHDEQTSLEEIRNKLRQIGSVHQHLNLRMSSEDWKAAKVFLTNCLSPTNDRWHEKSCSGYENPASQLASFLIAEIKTGFLCEMVHETVEHQHHLQRRNAFCTPASVTSARRERFSTNDSPTTSIMLRPLSSCPITQIRRNPSTQSSGSTPNNAIDRERHWAAALNGSTTMAQRLKKPGLNSLSVGKSGDDTSSDDEGDNHLQKAKSTVAGARRAAYSSVPQTEVVDDHSQNSRRGTSLYLGFSNETDVTYMFEAVI